jgi:CRISPR-associated protein Cmr2
MVDPSTKISSSAIAIAWCLTWGENREPQYPLAMLQQMRQAMIEEKPVPKAVRSMVEQLQTLQDIPKEYFPETLLELQQKYSELWNQSTPIGLVYGGATKIKQYVFEAAKLPDIRGASALLDRINSIDLPAFFSCENDPENYPQCSKFKDFCCQVREEWLNLDPEFQHLSQALIPELIIYSTGGNILAFCPAAYVDHLANAIEKRYTHETLTANSSAVGNTFRLLEIRFGRLQQNIGKSFWLENCQANLEHPLIDAYFPQAEIGSEQAFKNRKNFNELVGQLATQFNQRRSGNDKAGRPSRRYPPMFETHPYLRRDESDRRSAVFQAKSDSPDSANGLPGDPWFSETSIRKRLVGQIAKRDSSQEWYQNSGLDWQPGEAFYSWVNKFEQFVHETPQKYYGKVKSINLRPSDVEEARSVREIGNASTPNGFIAYIYADGNNMGGYIQKEIKTPEDYQRFSQDIFDATEKSVYVALAKHLKPHQYKPDATSGRRDKEVWIHPFEILTIGGDDVMLIVPASRALAIAQSIAEEFENRLKQKGYTTDISYEPENIHRYKGEKNLIGNNQCKLSMSTGVLLTAEDTPIYYADRLVGQLLKSAKRKAKELKVHGYLGGTVDFLTLKAVTMISSNIQSFRDEGLTKSVNSSNLRLYAAPYTLYELGGLLKTVGALHQSDFPKSQLYQIRSLLERGRHTAILNYRYFRVRLKQGQEMLRRHFEQSWCEAKTNDGNIAPWMAEISEHSTAYETIWRDLVDLYDFLEPSDQEAPSSPNPISISSEVHE